MFDAGEDVSNLTLQGFREQFGEFLKDDATKDISQVVVLVDDLDRSLPDTVVETLEAIKLFLSVDRMSFAIAADENNVARAIGQRLTSTGQPITAHQYLEKIVQIPFRIPALSRALTEEYLALLLIGPNEDEESINRLLDRAQKTRENGSSLAARFEGLIPSGSESDIALAERLAPILHRHTEGNPRRLKRFLNALWLRTALAKARGVELEVDACAKLLVAELLHPDLFAQLLGWLATGTLKRNISGIESGEGGFATHFIEWGRLDPPINELDVAPYLLLAASLRGDSIEEASLDPGLRDLVDKLAADSKVIRDDALREALNLDHGSLAIVARFIASKLRLEKSVERQGALAATLSGLALGPIVSQTVAAELRLMRPEMVLTPVPLSLLSINRPAEFRAVVNRWKSDPLVGSRTKRSASEALKEVN